MQEAGVRRIAVGIGNTNAIATRELQEIASSNDDVLRVSSYSQLLSKLESIMKLACEGQYPGKLAQPSGNNAKLFASVNNRESEIIVCKFA